MTTTMAVPRPLRPAFLFMTSILWLSAGCDGESPPVAPNDPPIVPEETGTLQVEVGTFGPNPDPDGYRIHVGGVGSTEVATIDTALFQGIAPGDHRVRIDGVNEDCAVAGAERTEVEVRPFETSTVAFRVNCGGPVAVPDGVDLLVAGCCEEGPNLFGIDLDTGRRVDVTRFPHAFDDHPAWSPDGSRIAFVSKRDGRDYPSRWSIYVADLTSGRLRRVTSGKHVIEELTWSPDGTRIAFARSRHPLKGFNYEIHVVPADGSSSPRRIVDDGTHPSWSPDGALIAYETSSGDLWLVDPDGVDPRPLLPKGPDARYHDPAWSPDGQRIAFLRWGFGEQKDRAIWTADRNGRDRRRVTRTRRDQIDREPTWSPDGRWIAYTRTPPDPPFVPEVWVTAADGGAARAAAGSVNHDWQPDWRPVDPTASSGLWTWRNCRERSSTTGSSSSRWRRCPHASLHESPPGGSMSSEPRDLLAR